MKTNVYVQQSEKMPIWISVYKQCVCVFWACRCVEGITMQRVKLGRQTTDHSLFALRHNGEQNRAFLKSVERLKIIHSTHSATYKARQEEKDKPSGVAERDREKRKSGRVQNSKIQKYTMMVTKLERQRE